MQFVKDYIGVAKKNGVTIRLPAEYYVSEIDQVSQNSIDNGEEEGLENRWVTTFRTIVVMEGDWDNGKDKLELARELMGPEIFQDYKERYPEKYENLLRQSKSSEGH